MREDAEGGWKEGRAGLGNQKVGRRQLRGHLRAQETEDSKERVQWPIVCSLKVIYCLVQPTIKKK